MWLKVEIERRCDCEELGDWFPVKINISWIVVHMIASVIRHVTNSDEYLITI